MLMQLGAIFPNLVFESTTTPTFTGFIYKIATRMLLAFYEDAIGSNDGNARLGHGWGHAACGERGKEGGGREGMRLAERSQLFNEKAKINPFDLFIGDGTHDHQCSE
ncbi:hypothetical protein C1H46_044146 [Malus baccata]|uniref:Uncharacterized protein n=1 Tax=Malus baccata TaxID=106549 RepID=A0A540K7V5_MALBA|nr:hypothetical protein C1H46_044146 [Malus baccata]